MKLSVLDSRLLIRVVAESRIRRLAVDSRRSAEGWAAAAQLGNGGSWGRQPLHALAHLQPSRAAWGRGSGSAAGGPAAAQRDAGWTSGSSLHRVSPRGRHSRRSVLAPVLCTKCRCDKGGSRQGNACLCWSQGDRDDTPGVRNGMRRCRSAGRQAELAGRLTAAGSPQQLGGCPQQ